MRCGAILEIVQNMNRNMAGFGCDAIRFHVIRLGHSRCVDNADNTFLDSVMRGRIDRPHAAMRLSILNRRTQSSVDYLA